jgi:hypothetical protein
VVELRHIVHRRAIRIYVAAIVVPALVLLYLGLKSVQRQRDAIDALLVSNLRLSGEKLASELEHRTAQLAEACLREAAGVDVGTSDERQIRLQFERLREQHPIARYFFLLEGNSVRYPRLRTPPPRQLEAYATSEDPARGKKYVALFREAEDQELRLDHPAQALAGYRRCYELPTAASLKALALSRVARCLQKSGRPGAAQQAYRTLLENYGDLRTCLTGRTRWLLASRWNKRPRGKLSSTGTWWGGAGS